ncbi:MAG: hypothetical protein IID16_03665 [Candidatus Marinimicrobia bacterium]|nr:hypothetical protein [Candidatus Neomarinimicrobiota bacterium]
MIYQNKYQNTARLRIYIILIVMGILLLTGGGCSAMLEKIRQTRKQLIFSVTGHYWIYDYPWLAPNIIRIQVVKGGISDPLQVTIAQERPVRFEFERYPFRNGN